jgi:pyrimidine deaminase RibD-like protein
MISKRNDYISWTNISWDRHMSPSEAKTLRPKWALASPTKTTKSFPSVQRNADGFAMTTSALGAWRRPGEQNLMFATRVERHLEHPDGTALKGCSLYVTLFPCNECAKAIIQSGIKEVVFGSDKYADQISFKASKKMFEMAGVTYREYIGRTPSIEYR